jgi:hypothetical protein
LAASTMQHDASHAIDTFREAARLNREEVNRDGALIRLPGYGQVVMTGDIHGHRKNLEKLQKYAMLERVTARHVILHEMVHEEKHGDAIDHSHEVLLLGAKYKCEFPEQVHFLQSNHELAQLTGYQIAKNGRLVIQDFSDAVIRAYGKARGDEVLAAMNEFITSFPLAIITQNRIWMSHSLPNATEMKEFDLDVFKRPPTFDDLKNSKTIFSLVWGRRQSKEQLDHLAQILDVDVFIVGHQPQEMGYDFLHERLIILASDHNHGTFLPFDLSKKQTADELIRNIRKFVAVA